jgi:hypothetical protein
MGMFHDGGIGTRMTNNRAAGSERAGFSGPGVPCSDADRFGGNVAHSSLVGYMFDYYSTKGSCVLLPGFTAWAIWEYGKQQSAHHACSLKANKLVPANLSLVAVANGCFRLCCGAALDATSCKSSLASASIWLHM